MARGGSNTNTLISGIPLILKRWAEEQIWLDEKKKDLFLYRDFYGNIHSFHLCSVLQWPIFLGVLGFPVAQTIKNLPAMQKTQVQFLGREDPLEKGMATHSSILAWRIPWTEEPCRLQSMGSQRVRHNWATEYTWGNHRCGAHIASSAVSLWHREDTCYYGGWIIEGPNETRGTLPRV